MSLSTTMNASKVDAILNARQINGFEADGGTDKQTTHSYGPVYEALLEPFVDKQCTILEVGVQLGGSMLLWHDLCPLAPLSERKICDTCMMIKQFLQERQSL